MQFWVLNFGYIGSLRPFAELHMLSIQRQRAGFFYRGLQSPPRKGCFRRCRFHFTTSPGLMYEEVEIDDGPASKFQAALGASHSGSRESVAIGLVYAQ